MRTGRSIHRAASVALLFAMTLVACSSGGSSSSSTTTPGTSVTVPPDAPVTRSTPARLDGRLAIGALLPRSGPGAALGETLIDAVHLAVGEINAAGGVLLGNVELEPTDEGGTISSALRNLEILFDRNVDVIVGPASSRVALGVLSEMRDTGLTVCSPTNTAISLRRFPDDDRYFRTIPSDALQAKAMAQEIIRTGGNAVAILYIDDEFGLDYSTALSRELEARGIGVEEPIAFDPDAEDLTPAGTAAVESGATAIALIGDPVDGGRMLSTLRQLDQGEVDYFINDALRQPNLVASLGGSSESFLMRLHGVAPSAASESEAFNAAFTGQFPDAPTEYAAYAYDCTVLLALAATAAGSDDPAEIARYMASVSRIGSPCTTFAECKQLLGEGRNIDYVGTSGSVEFDDQGDVQGGSFTTFQFEPSGMDFSTGDVNV